MRGPSKRTAHVCLFAFALGAVGWLVPLHRVPLVGPLLNHIAVYLLIGGYALLLASIYVL